nr:putative phospholipid-transporting ATPase 9 [Ipomoea batatas]
MRTGRRRKLHLSKIYSFRCGRSSFNKEDQSQIGGPGFSRVVFCNEPDAEEASFRNYSGNYGIMAFTPLAPYTAVTAILPLIIVIGATMDIEVNSRKVKVHLGGGVFEDTEWRNLKVGAVVKVQKDEFFPADLLLLSSNYDDAICYVETMNLDGETNLKLKQALEVSSTRFPPQQLLLRDSKLRNTEYVYGVVIFTGHDTKVMQNATEPPSKRSKIERKMDKIIYFLFGVLFTFALVGSIYFGITTRQDLDDGHQRCYLIPISLYVSIEIVKVLQSIFINQDINMYYEETDKPANARTSNLNEELGQVDTILSDKTGTLTCNSMEFVKCSVAGTAYGRGITEVERAMARRKGSPLMVNGRELEDSPDVVRKSTVKGFNFDDERIMGGSWINEPRSDVIQKFFRLLAVCHTVIPEVDEASRKVSYEAESPDEAAFVIAAREIGFEFNKRTQSSVSILNVLEFNSARKRMSVIVQDEDGKILLLCKGADSVMFERLALNGREFEENTREHVHEYADAGLRTLILAYRELAEEEYRVFNEQFTEAKNLVSADRDAMIDEVTERVPECIDKLAQAGIKIWVLTGDKMETAINIGYACSLLRQGMKQIIVNLDAPENHRFGESGRQKSNSQGFKKKCPLSNLLMGKLCLLSSNNEAFALIVDGKSLTYALEDGLENLFLDLAIRCASVICCRSSPKQKALVTRLVKIGTGKTTLANW